MKLHEIVVDFDAREMEEDFRSQLSQSDQGTFLIRADIVKPLSVDKAIWKSVVQTEESTSYQQTRFADLAQLNKHLSKIAARYWIIAISQYLAVSDLACLVFTPTMRDPNWALLGYDVAEKELLSGLMDMGYRSEERTYALQEYGHSLNRYHLFDDQSIAFQFASWSNNRDPGHGPFFVCGIYFIQEVHNKTLQNMHSTSAALEYRYADGWIGNSTARS